MTHQSCTEVKYPLLRACSSSAALRAAGLHTHVRKGLAMTHQSCYIKESDQTHNSCCMASSRASEPLVTSSCKTCVHLHCPPALLNPCLHLKPKLVHSCRSKMKRETREKYVLKYRKRDTQPTQERGHQISLACHSSQTLRAAGIRGREPLKSTEKH